MRQVRLRSMRSSSMPSRHTRDTDVPAPSYTLNPDTLEIFTDIGQVVQSAIGNATLTAGAMAAITSRSFERPVAPT